MRNVSEAHGFWGVVTRKAKAILEDDVEDEHEHTRVPRAAAYPQQQQRQASASTWEQDRGGQTKPEKVIRKGFGAIASKLNSIGSALEEGLNLVENRTADIFQETRNRRLSVRTKATSDLSKQPMDVRYAGEPVAESNNTVPQSDLDIQLQASRDVAMAMAAKTKLLLRELKTVKADLAFAKERCAQLEEENRMLRESMENGDNPEDDDLVRLQLETLLAEKARLAQENAFYARENRFLREVVEYHQLTMQDVVYLNERSAEITEVYPARVPSFTNLNSMDTSPSLSPSFRSSDFVKRT